MRRYITNYRESPPAPRFSTCVPRYLLGYEERKKEEALEASRNRALTKPEVPSVHQVLTEPRSYF